MSDPRFSEEQVLAQGCSGFVLLYCAYLLFMTSDILRLCSCVTWELGRWGLEWGKSMNEAMSRGICVVIPSWFISACESVLTLHSSFHARKVYKRRNRRYSHLYDLRIYIYVITTHTLSTSKHSQSHDDQKKKLINTVIAASSQHAGFLISLL